MENLVVNDQPAVKIKSKLIRRSEKSGYYNCEGDKVWIADSCCIYNDKEGTLLIQEWLYKTLENQGKL